MQTSYTAETISIEGTDALAFAQAQFSANVDALATSHWQFSAWLDAQGRVRAFFHLARVADDHLLLLLRGGDAARIADELRRFVFRSKLRIEAQPPRALGTGPALPLHAIEQFGDTLALGCGDHRLEIGAPHGSDDAWRLPQIRAGWPWLPEQTLNALLPAALMLERLHATALDKGCYPGQEMVARLHYRGGHKRHLHCVTLSQMLSPGSMLREGDDDAIRLLDTMPVSSGAQALAVMRDDIAARGTSGLSIVHEGQVVALHIIAFG